MYRKVFFFGTLSLLIIIAFACGSNDPAKAIIGKWVVIKQDIIYRGEPVKFNNVGKDIEFLSDKTYISKFKNQGTWTILDDGRIKLQDMMGTIEFATIKGNQMIMDKPDEIYTVNKLILEKKVASSNDNASSASHPVSTKEAVTTFLLLVSTGNLTTAIKNTPYSSVIGETIYKELRVNGNINKIDTPSEWIDGERAGVGFIIYFNNGKKIIGGSNLIYTNDWKFKNLSIGDKTFTLYEK